MIYPGVKLDSYLRTKWIILQVRSLENDMQRLAKSQCRKPWYQQRTYECLQIQ